MPLFKVYTITSFLLVNSLIIIVSILLILISFSYICPFYITKGFRHLHSVVRFLYSVQISDSCHGFSITWSPHDHLILSIKSHDHHMTRVVTWSLHLSCNHMTRLRHRISWPIVPEPSSRWHHVAPWLHHRYGTLHHKPRRVIILLIRSFWLDTRTALASRGIIITM